MLTLEQIQIKKDDRVSFTTKGGEEHSGVVIDADDPAKIRLKIDTGREVYVGRAAVKREEAAVKDMQRIVRRVRLRLKGVD